MFNKNMSKNRVYITIVSVLMIVAISTISFNFKSKAIGSAATRDYVEGTIFEENIPLSGSVAQNSIGPSVADTAANKEFAMSVFNKVNEVRNANGLTSLTWSEGLYKAGLVRATEIVSKWSHTRPNGTDWYTVDANLMYGENLGKGFTSSDDVVDAWMNSASHKDNILYGFKTMAVSVYKSSDGTYYIAQEFGF